MRNNHIITLILVCFVLVLTKSYVSGQVPTIDQLKIDSVRVTTGITFKLHSKALEEDRIVMISVPEGYEKTTKKYPVYYLLDGQWGFSSTTQTLGWLSNPRYGMIPQMIVVGLHTGGDNRARDLAPTQDKGNKSGGGADKLYKFIKEELIPFVDKNYRTYNYRVIGGASLGGLFVMYAFVSDPQLFNGYLSMSPSMFWDNKVMLDRTRDLLSKNPNLHSRLHISVTNEGIQMGVDSLASILEKYASKELAWKFDKHPEEVHETVTYKSTWDGMKFLLADWYYPLVDFGTKDHVFSSLFSDNQATVNHKIINLSGNILEKYAGLYLDSYGRILVMTKTEKTLLLSGNRLPTVALYPEAENKFFIKDNDVQNELFLKGFNVQLEFVKEDSIVVTANGKIDCSAKKIKCPPLVTLSDDILKRYVGTYSPSDQSNKINITKEGNLLKFSGDDMLPTYLYPIGENKFYTYVSGGGYELEFIMDGSNNVTKINILNNGKVVFETKKVN
jgi:predicted alpha/beta superfamily hydrolase